jgi:hypothetical protein
MSKIWCNTLVPEALFKAKLMRGEKEEPLVTSVENPTSTLDNGLEFESRMCLAICKNMSNWFWK